MNLWSSLRRTVAPIPVALMLSSRTENGPLLGGLLRRTCACAHGAATGGDRLDDVVITRAATQIAFELRADGVLVEFVPLAVHDIDRRHDHARRTEAALQSVIVAEGFLHRVQLVTVGEALDRGDLGVFE